MRLSYSLLIAACMIIAGCGRTEGPAPGTPSSDAAISESAARKVAESYRAVTASRNLPGLLGLLTDDVTVTFHQDEGKFDVDKKKYGELVEGHFARTKQVSYQQNVLSVVLSSDKREATINLQCLDELDTGTSEYPAVLVAKEAPTGPKIKSMYFDNRTKKE